MLRGFDGRRATTRAKVVRPRETTVGHPTPWSPRRSRLRSWSRHRDPVPRMRRRTARVTVCGERVRLQPASLGRFWITSRATRSTKAGAPSRRRRSFRVGTRTSGKGFPQAYTPTKGYRRSTRYRASSGSKSENAQRAKLHSPMSEANQMRMGRLEPAYRNALRTARWCRRPLPQCQPSSTPP